MGVKFEGKPVEGTVTIVEKDGTEAEVKQKVGEEVLPANYATVGCRMGHTKNLGNYESLRVEVSISWPCPADGDSIESTYGKCKEWVESKLEAVIKEVEDI
jgi:hypothetical protein